MKFVSYFVMLGLSLVLFSSVTQAWTTDDRGEIVLSTLLIILLQLRLRVFSQLEEGHFSPIVSPL